MFRFPNPELPEYSPQQGCRESAPPREWMDNQVFDKSTTPALRDTDYVLPLIDREETKVGVKLVIISKARPPLFKRPNVAPALGVPDVKKAMNRRRIVISKRPQAMPDRERRRCNYFSQVAA